MCSTPSDCSVAWVDNTGIQQATDGLLVVACVAMSGSRRWLVPGEQTGIRPTWPLHGQGLPLSWLHVKAYRDPAWGSGCIRYLLTKMLPRSGRVRVRCRDGNHCSRNKVHVREYVKDGNMPK